MDLTSLFSGQQGVILAIVLGVGAALALGGFQQLKISEHKWAGKTASALSALGLSSTVTNPLNDLAAGDVPSALGHGAALADYLGKSENQISEAVNVLKKLNSLNPQAIAKFNADLAAGKDDTTLQSDVKDAFAGLPQLTPGPIAQKLQAVQQNTASILGALHIQAINPALAPTIATLIDSGLAHLAPAVAAGAAHAQVAPPVPAAKDASPTADATQKTG